MALTDESNGNGFYMPVAPAYGAGNGGFGNGFGGDGWWILLLLLFAGNGGWGFGGGFGGMMGMGMMDGFGLYPWLNNSQNINDGFRDQMLNSNVTSIRDGISALSTQLCQCCGDMQMALANGFANAETAANARQMANMQQAFAAQTATMQGFNGVQSQIAQASADNRLGIAGIGSDIAREACATRTNDTQNTQAILNVINGGIQSIKDQLCQDKIDAKNDEIANLRQTIAMKDLAASQTAQNAFIAQGFSNEVDQLYNRLNSCPVPTTPVYGRTPIFQCNQNQGCGCGCGCNGSAF
jgi:hypothetical protein